VDLYLARQPIFDLRGEVCSYELLYRRTAHSHFADGRDTGQMSRDVVVHSFLEIGVGRITHGKTAFVNFGREMLVEGWYELLDPDMLVIEVLEEVQVDAEVISACERLSGAGYRLALDDFVAGGGQEALLPFATVVKVDVLDRDPDEILGVTEPLRRAGVRLLAEKVECPRMHAECRRLGFELFQGYFFCRPELVASRGVSVEQASIVRLMNLLGSDLATDHEIEEAFRRDVSLAYKLLRMLSTAAQAGRGIESIRYAVRLLGRSALQRWLSLLLASSFAGGSGTDAELLHTAVVRGRFCELLGLRAKRANFADSLFLVGLFSLMDALLREPMQEILERVDLAPSVRCALLGGESVHSDFLRLAQAYEGGEWEAVVERAPRLGLATAEVAEIYLSSLGWARAQLNHAA
jgi:c-di-GMP phosphodiesterase